MAWYYPARDRYVLHGNDNQPQQIHSEAVSAAEPASPQSIRLLGGSEAMVDLLEQLPAAERASAFVVLFRDGRLLLGSTDPETCAQICAGRGARVTR
jgi:hypothetical protein